MKIQIVIPMSGFGERFRRAGYKIPKPLIEVEGKPIIAHVLDMFPGETDITFICNQAHLDEPAYRMRETLANLCPTGRIIGISAHRLGPVHAVQQVAHLLDSERPIVVNYCDFTCYWDWPDFRDFVKLSECVGAIPAYKGFHPHTLGTTNYAYMREVDGRVLSIQEKQPYTSNRMEEYASSGTYYFASVQIMLDAIYRQIEEGLDTDGEYYVSLTYRPLLAAGMDVAVYPLQHFMQWGTPQDLAEYTRWSNAFRQLGRPRPHFPKIKGALVVPMAGLGTRFSKEGYHLPKPLIPVSGIPMALQAVKDMPFVQEHAFVLRKDMLGREELETALHANYDEAVIAVLPEVTSGQAITAKIGLETLEQARGPLRGPVTFTVCDSGCLYNHEAFNAALSTGADVLVWGIRGHANAVAHPEMYGWLDVDDGGAIKNVSVKKPLADPTTDPIVLGMFTFRDSDIALKMIDRLLERDGKVNGEFYLDSTIDDALAAELSVKLFEVDHFLCWGVPNDLKTFEYWQSCFHKWPTHPYTLEQDARIAPKALEGLKKRYSKMVPERRKKL